ncbi:LamG domain-containing protein [Actinomycetes bacterium KLBMP 9797]
MAVASARQEAPESRYAGPRVAEAPDTATAVVVAARQQSRVAVADLTTQTRLVYAQPDGTLRAELTASPVRVRQGGRWVGVDTTLVRRPDGTVGPRAADVELAFSAGGNGPLVRYGRDGQRIALTWPGRLPAPALAGATATYAEVLPGVDLVLRASVGGFAQHLVVKTATAARDPKLRQIRLGVTGQGVTVRATKDGALEVRDRKGAVVFGAPPSVMWDSRQPARREAKVGVTVDRGTLSLRPDRTLLTDPDTVFPVTIDPVVDNRVKWGWATVLSGKPTTSYWWSSGDGVNAQVGNCYNGNGQCNGIGVAWSYFQFDTGFLNGKRVIAAGLNTTVVHSPNCSDYAHQLFMANAGIHSGTTWNNRPQGWFVREVSSPNACGGRRGVGFDALGAVNTVGHSTYFLKAADEGNQLAWRKYDPAETKLYLHYNTAPNAPYELRTDPPLPAACRWCEGRPYLGDDWIRLQTRLSDPDNDQIKPIWSIYGGPEAEHRDWGPWQGSGAAFSTDVDLRGRHGQHVTWTVWASDGTDGGPWTNGPGPFVVDQVGVDKAPGVTAGLYPADNRWHGGAGVPGRFTFDAAGVGDIDHYLYGWQDPPATKVDAAALGGTASVLLTPPGDGPRDLYVQSVDRAGHRSPTRVHHFYVRPGNGPAAQWAFEGNAEDTAYLGDRDGTLGSGATYAEGAVGTGLRTAGTGTMTAPTTVRTDASFSVSAWVKLDSVNDRWVNAVAQRGAQQCAFCLQYVGDRKRWVFVMPQTDEASPKGWDHVTAPAAPVEGQWTHLAGVYDAEAKQVAFYVDGELAGTAPRAASWHGAGQLVVGHGLVGAVDEVKVYDRVLAGAEVRAEVSRDNVQLGHWRLDEVAGDTAANAVPGGVSGVRRGGARFVPDGGAVGGAVALANASGTPADVVSMAGPVLRTDQSFSVGGWLRLDELPAATHASTAITQEGAVNSAFFLGYRNTDGGRWEFHLPSADTVTRAEDAAVRSAGGTAPRGEWAHVVGVYDAAAKQIRLYVDGELAGTAPHTSGFHATGEFVLGRGKWEGVLTNQWRGALDEVRAYSRVLTTAEIQGIVAQSDVTAGTWKLDGDAVDASGRDRNGTLAGKPDWTGGQSSTPDPGDLAVRLNGTGAHVSAPHAVDTSQSFAVTAWARLDKVGGHPAVVSQDGSRVSAFQLQATPDGRWAFTMFGADADGGGSVHDRVLGPAVQIGAWTHLAAVHDVGARRISLYVNGVLAGALPHAGAWNHATGGVQIGAAQWNGARLDFFPGSIDDVSVYSRPLFAEEIRVLAGRDLSLVHQWALDESSGSSAADAVGSRRGTLGGGAAFAPGRSGNAVRLDGVDDTVSTAGVDLRTDKSFTVTSWVYLTAKDCDLDRYTRCVVDAVTVDGAKTSKFRLGHVIDDGQSPSGAWTFEMPESDAADARITKAVVTTEPSELNRWVHLAAVYDAPTKKLWLYVDGVRIGDGTLNTPWHAEGGVQIGRGRAGGEPAEYWPGRVDDVRLYTGPLDKARVLALYRSYPAQEGPATLPTADAGRWRFDESTGTTVADSSGKGRTATLKGGTGWIGGRDGAAAWLDGTSGYAETAGPVLDTSRSFSAAAWVYLTQGGGTVNRTVLAQDGNRVSSFALQYHPGDGKWGVVVIDSDKDDPTGTVLTSAEPAAVGDWTHLALAYDADLRQLRLYVNGVLSAAQVGITMWNATGPLSIGRAKYNGQPLNFFPRGIDDVRAFSRALSDGEMRRLHDDVAVPTMDLWKFDDANGTDSTWQKKELAVSGGASYSPGVAGTGLQLDGVSGAAVAPSSGTSMRDSFSVSAWAKLSRTDQAATVAAQDGARMSGFQLQYRPALKRWVFGAPTHDADASELVYAASLTAPPAGRWTHLTGVYDYPARQLRLYVDGTLAGIRDNVTLWRATGAFTVGRGKVDGQPADFFPGTLDEVTVAFGAPPDASVAGRAAWPAPLAGQLGRYVNGAGDRYTGSTTAAARAGYHFESALGALVAAGQPNTRTLYACLFGTDGFTSVDPACEGQTAVGAIGAVYTTPPTNLATVPVHRCNTGPDHYESRSGCAGATAEGVLGYAPAYAPLSRYYFDDGFADHLSTVDGTPPAYRQEGSAGLLSLVAQPGTTPLLTCRTGGDQFVSTDPACEGGSVLSTIGHVWTAATDGVGTAIYRCVYAGQRFVSRSATCEGQTVDRQLGYLRASPPDVTPVFE